MAFDVNHVLLAEDEERARKTLSYYLEKWGFHVTACVDGNDAAARLLEAEHAPAIALIDWEMPGLEGIEICRRVRARTDNKVPYTYLILVTGRSDKSEITRGLAAGADDYVTKPFDVDELQARLLVGQRVVNLERRLADHIERLREALDQIGQINDNAPVCLCPSCKRTRDPYNRWQAIELYLQEHTGATPTHELCPDCRASGA